MGIDEQHDLLKEALACYAGGDPSPGIEQRVLRRVRAPRHAQRFRWALAGLAAACVIVAIMIPREETLEIHAPALVAPLPVLGKFEAPHLIGKPDRFPSPAPLTHEERMLLALADTNAFAESADTEITPIQIDAIVVPPIGE